MKGLEQRDSESHIEHIARLVAENITAIAALPSDQRHITLHRLIALGVARQRPDDLPEPTGNTPVYPSQADVERMLSEAFSSTSPGLAASVSEVWDLFENPIVAAAVQRELQLPTTGPTPAWALALIWGFKRGAVWGR